MLQSAVRYEDIMNPDDPLTFMKESLLQSAGKIASDGELEKAYMLYKQERDNPDQAKFDYSCALIRSKHSSNIEYGVKSLKIKRAVEAGDKNADEQLMTGCLYYIAFGFFRLLKFDMAVLYGNLLLNEAGSGQAKAIVSLATDIIRYPHLYDQLFKKKLVEKGSSSVLAPKKEVSSKLEKEKSRTDKSNQEAAKALRKQKKLREKEEEDQRRRDEEDAKKAQKLKEKKRKELQKKKTKRDQKGGPNEIDDLADELLQEDDTPGRAPPVAIPTLGLEEKKKEKKEKALSPRGSSRKDPLSPRSRDKPRGSTKKTTHVSEKSTDKDQKKYISQAKKEIDRKELRRMKKENIPFAPPPPTSGGTSGGAPSAAYSGVDKSVSVAPSIHDEIKKKVGDRKEQELLRLQEELAEKQRTIEEREKRLREEAELQEEMDEVLPFYSPASATSSSMPMLDGIQLFKEPYDDPEYFDDEELAMLGGAENLARLRKNLATLEKDYSSLLDDDMLDTLEGMDAVMVRPLVDLADINNTLNSFEPTSYSDSLQSHINSVLPDYGLGGSKNVGDDPLSDDIYGGYGDSSPLISSSIEPPVEQVWIVVRRFGKRGGKKMERPANIEELKAQASEKFGVEIVNIRELDTEAEVEDTAAIKADSIVLALTAADEEEFD